MSDSEVTGVLENSPNQPQKGTADSRYLWPTVVFEMMCICIGNFGGVDCNECNFGWTGNNCTTRKTPVIRKSFNRLTETEKQTVVNAISDLKNEMGYWSVIVEEPSNYTSGNVTLQNVSTYNFFVFLHQFVARSDSSKCTKELNNNVPIDFAHSGPVFPVWHRRYLLTVEKEIQRITNNPSFGLPYWQWEEDDRSPFTQEYFGTPSNSAGDAVNVSGNILNPDDWHTICDLTYAIPGLNCSEYWRVCNPANDLAAQRPLQRGGGTTYVPNRVEVMTALAAPAYDAADAGGKYAKNAPRQSFRNRMEGWAIICSAVTCTGSRGTFSHLHNDIHLWVGGHLADVPAAVNDPIFNLHHCNVDRVFESWIQRFFRRNLNSSLPPYVPDSGAHPGHNRDDYMVPFVPVVTAGGQYRAAVEWGYIYDELIPANISDDTIPDCSSVIPNDTCPVCDANSTCIDCTNQTCPDPMPGPTSVPIADTTVVSSLLPLGLGLGLGLGIPLLVAIAIIILLVIVIVILSRKKSKPASSGKGLEMTAVKT